MSSPNNTEATEEKTENTSPVNRRKFLSALSAAGGTGILATKQVSATQTDLQKQEKKERAKEVREKYSTTDAIRDALEEHTLGFVKGLYDEGYLPEPTLDQFKLDEVSTLKEALDEQEGVTVNSMPTGEGDFRADITLYKTTKEGSLEIHTVPKTGRTFAVENPRDKEKRTPIKQTDDGPTPDEFCQTKRRCIATNGCGCKGHQGCIHDKYDIDCCKDGCYYTQLYQCCSDGTCWNSPICDCYC